ncbi:hypothetical protein, partial [Azospirillum sp. TSO5]|uniref:hypothetical protein n=1 Tax=Azospirillum sp. TSO5 TaxID=716760 RepID=UPI001B3C07E0
PASNCSQDGWPGHSHSHADSESDSKTSQDGDIKDAKRLWAEYKRRKAGAARKAAEEARRQAKKR